MIYFSTNKQLILYSVGLLFFVKFFQRSFLNDIFFQLHSIFLLASLSYLIYFLIDYFLNFSINNNKKYSNQLIYLSLLPIFVPFYGAYNSFFEFQQPVFYGILSLRSWWGIGFAFYVYNQLCKEKINIDFLISCLVGLGYFSIIFYIFTYLFIDLDAYAADSIKDSIVRVDDSRGVRLRFNDYFTSFSIIYYVFKLSKNFKSSYFAGFIIFLLYFIFLSQSRTILFSLFLTSLFIMLYDFKTLNNLLSRLLIIFISSASLILAMFMFFSEQMNELIFLFQNSFSVLNLNSGFDVSANSRITTSILAYSFLSKDLNSLFFGAGQFSSVYQGGISEFIGWYFYPMDIGILGGLYTFGIIGAIIIFLIPLIFSLLIMFEILKNRNLINEKIFTAYMIYLILINFAQGNFFFMPFMIFLVILILNQSINSKKFYSKNPLSL